MAGLADAGATLGLGIKYSSDYKPSEEIIEQSRKCTALKEEAVQAYSQQGSEAAEDIYNSQTYRETCFQRDVVRQAEKRESQVVFERKIRSLPTIYSKHPLKSIALVVVAGAVAIIHEKLILNKKLNNQQNEIIMKKEAPANQ